MYAIVEISGKQFKVEKKQKLFVNRLEAAEGKKVSFDNVLMVNDGSKMSVGRSSSFFLDFLYSVPIVRDCPLSTVSEKPSLSCEKIFVILILELESFKFFMLFGLYLKAIFGVK